MSGARTRDALEKPISRLSIPPARPSIPPERAASSGVLCCTQCWTYGAPTDAHCAQCGARLDESRTRHFIDGRYEPLRELGSGSMGTVQLARDVALKRDVAVKLIAGERNETPEAVEAFYREAAALASIRHENVVQVHSFGLHRRSCYFAMEYVQGTTLERVLQTYSTRDERVPPHRALSILRRVADGLAAVHAAGMVHCDVKPTNIVIESATGRPVLVDFGIAVRVNPIARSSEPPVGTPPYMAPEQIVPGRALTPQTDVYGLACTAFELLTGQEPFPANDMTTVLQHQVRTPAPLLADVDPRLGVLDPIMQRALSKDPFDRFDSMRAFARSLDAAIERFEPTPSMPPVAVGQVEHDETPTRPAPALHVLLVDDHVDFAELARLAIDAAFRGVSTQVSVAHSGEEALRMCRVAPALVVLDQHMPGIDGIGTLSLLRERPGGGAMRVLVCSAAADAEARAHFGLLGVTEFCPKPVGFGELVSRLERLAIRYGWKRG